MGTPRRVSRVAKVVTAAVAAIVGLAGAPSALGGGSASFPAVARAASFPDTPAGFCAAQTTGAPDDASALAFCTDLVQDLAEIGHLLGLPVIRPTGSSLTTPVKVIFSKEAGSTATTALMTRPFGNEPCEINVYPVGYDNQISPGTGVSAQLHVQIAHEVVHCYQNLIGTGFPDWVSDGSATYLATLYARRGEGNTDGSWKRWIGGSDTADENESLTLRGYDAIGWHSLVAHVSGDPLWSKMASAWKAYLSGGATAYIAALGGDSTAVATAWAPSVLNRPSWGDAWTTPAAFGVVVPAIARPTEFIGLTAGTGSDRKRIEPLSAIVDNESDVDNALIEVSVSDGYASVHDAAGYSDIGFQDEFFCLGTGCKADAVSCPGAKTPLKPIELTPPFVVAAGGGSTAATYEIAKIPQPAAPGTPVVAPASAGPCKPRAAGAVLAPRAGYSEGDPHLETLDGGVYDFQAAGEYTLVRSDNGEVQVQARQVPALSSQPASFNNAVALRVDNDTVEIDPGLSPVILVNGRWVTLAANGVRRFPGGGRLSETGAHVVARWPDGSEADVFVDAFGEDVTFTPPPVGVDHLTGLLTALVLPKTKGRQASQETLTGGDGHRYVLDPSTKAGFTTLYGAFARSWRVTPKTSLFTYPKGKSTESYDVKGFPAREATIAGLPASKKAAAQKVCRAAGVTDPKLMDDCVLDVGLTGAAELATMSAQVQNAVAGPTKPPIQAASPQVTQAGSTHPATYYFTHPCEALTAADIKSALGQSVPANPGVGDLLCVIETHPTDVVAFSHESVAKFKSEVPAAPGSGPVSGLRNGAYCVVTETPGTTGTELATDYVLVDLSGAESLKILADSCAQGSALAKAILSHISGS